MIEPQDRLRILEVTVSKQTVILEYLTNKIEGIEESLKPITENVNMWAGAGKLVFWAGVALGAFGAVIKVLEYAGKI